MPFKGVVANVIAVLAGSLLGLTIGHKLPERIKTIILRALGLGTLVIGFNLALKTHSVILIIGSLVIGAILGTLWDIEARLEGLGERLKTAVRSDSSTFVRGFVFASLLFCIGPMTLVGSLQDGTGDSQLLFTKSLMDGFASIALASSLGVGVVFSTLTVLLVQGALAFAGWVLSDLSASRVFDELSATGGLMIIAIALDLLDIRKLPVANFLPALAVVVPLAMAVERLGG